MPKQVKYAGQIHSFPDDASDNEIASVLDAMDKATYIKTTGVNPPADMPSAVPPGLMPNSGSSIDRSGNPTIVPKQGEPFAQTMQRGAAFGRTVTPEMRAAELKNAPQKIAATLGTAATMGLAGPAALALPGEIGGATVAAGGALKAAAQSPIGHAILAHALKEGMSAAKLGLAYKIFKKIGWL
jgi:hypothetical protein